MDDPQQSPPHPDLPARTLDRGDLSRIFRVTRQTIRDWERKGRLPKPMSVNPKPLWEAGVIAELLGR
jgi:hypothetical protein